MLPGRNDLCYCGSGKKYKNCCMDKDLQKERHERRLKEAQKQYAEIYAKLYAYLRERIHYKKGANARFLKPFPSIAIRFICKYVNGTINNLMGAWQAVFT